MKKGFSRRFFSLFVIVTAVVFINIINVIDEPEDNCKVPVDFVQSFIPGAEKIKSIREDCVFEVYGKSGKKIGTLLYADPDENSPSGFGGKMKVFLFVDNSQKVAGVFQGQNNETGSYIALLERKEFYNKWNGLKVNEAFDLEIDAVTGATMSSDAVAAMVKKNISIYTGSPEIIKTEKNILNSVTIAVSVFFIFSLVFFFFPVKTNKYRLILLFVSVTIPGFIAGSLASTEMFNNWIRNFSQAVASPIFIIVILSMIITLMKKRNIYCYYFCPMGSLQELLYKIPSPKKSPKPFLLKIAIIGRSIFLYIVIAFMIFGIFNDYSMFEPFSAFQFKAAAVSSIILFVVSCALSIFVPRPWCRFCPTGEVFESFRKVRKPQIPGSR